MTNNKSNYSILLAIALAAILQKLVAATTQDQDYYGPC